MSRKIKKIFIFSLPRTGSTLLQRILMAHSKINSIAEPNILLPLIFMTKNQGVITKYSHWVTYWGIRDLIDNLPNKEESFNKFTNEYATHFYNSLSDESHEYFVDKTPRYYFIIPEIAKIFPDAKFIFLFRNPVQIFASIIQTWGKDRFYLPPKNKFYVDLYEGVELISRGYELLKEKAYSIQYENFIKDPISYLKEIMKYLELDYEENMIRDFVKQDLKGGNVDPTGTKQYKKKETVTLEKWKDIFNTPYRKHVIKKYISNIDKNILETQGYDKSLIINDINRLHTKRNYYFIRDVIDFNKAVIRNKFNRLSFQ
jgi:hypothetical protein